MSQNPHADHTVIIAGGGTGGHLFPGIAVAQELRRRRPTWNLVFVGTAKGIEVKAVPRYGFELVLLEVAPLRGRGLLGALRGLGQVPAALGAAAKLLRRLRPSFVLGVGGYAAGPALAAAWGLRVPTAIMEQNAHAGLTNRLLGKLAKHILLAMPNRQLSQSARAQVVGNPVRADLVALRHEPRAWPDQFTDQRPLRMLIVGGSQGAHALNTAMVDLLPKLQHLPVAVRHQTGHADHAAVAEAYAKHPNVKAQASPFIDDMAQAYRQADVVLCRSGASTLAELAVVGLPSVLVPYPFAADDHQTANAQVMVEQGGAHLLPQSSLSAAALSQLLQSWLEQASVLRQMAERAWQFGKPEAVNIICDIIESGVHRV